MKITVVEFDDAIFDHVHCTYSGESETRVRRSLLLHLCTLDLLDPSKTLLKLQVEVLNAGTPAVNSATHLDVIVGYCSLAGKPHRNAILSTASHRRSWTNTLFRQAE